MKFNDKHKIILFSFAGIFLLWLIDAVIDSIFFSKSSFLDSLLNSSPKELYYRFFVLISLIAYIILFRMHWNRRRQIEKRYKNLVELSTDIIYLSDKDGNQVFMNDAAYRILERTPENVIGRPFLDLMHPDDRAILMKKLNEITNDKLDTFNFENRYVSQSGRVINVLHNVRVLRDEQGTFTGMQGIARDITQWKQYEDALHRSIITADNEKARSASILASIGDGISIQNTDFQVLYQNNAHKAMIGSDCTGKVCYEVYSHAKDVCPGCPVVLSFADGAMHTLEKTITQNGDVRYIEIRSSPLKDASGMIIAGIESVRDITARKQATEKLALFNAAIEEAMDGIQIVGPDGIILYSNKAIKEIYGFTPEELIGKNVNIMNADKEFSKSVILPRIRETGRWSGELMVLHKTGHSFPVWLSAAIVNDDKGNPIAMIGIVRDITEKKQADDILKRHHEQLMKLVEERTRELTNANSKLRKEMFDREKMEHELLKSQKLESLGILAGGIAHDFNNLLASIMGNISLALMDLNRDQDVYRLLESAEKASLRAQDLTQQLLTFSKGGAPVKKITSISDLVREAAGFALRGSRVNFDFIFTDDIWLVDVDQGQIGQVIHNLVINADHAMPEGGTINITCENIPMGDKPEYQLRAGDYVTIRIQDHGVGITKEHLLKIFDPYFTTKQKGSGLGLATTYSIIKKHGGHIIADSELGKGTTFTIYLPASAKQGRIPSKDDDTKVITGSGRILLMDDEEDVRLTTGAVLKRLGYTVEFTDGGAGAIELYQKAKEAGAPFDAVIMDLTIPGGMGGKEAIRKLVEIDPKIRAIVSSGYSNDPIMADYRKYGFSGVVTKPYRIKDLGDTLHTVLSSGEPTKG